MLKNFMVKYKPMLLYVLFGGLTTLVNIVVYWLCYEFFCIANIPSNCAAWIASVVFAFFTNKFFVFESHDSSCLVMVREFALFVAARLATGALDVLIMYVFVDILSLNPLLFKVLANIMVIVLNFVFSKLFVFAAGKN